MGSEMCIRDRICDVCTSELRYFEIQTIRGFSCANVAFWFLGRLLKVQAPQHHYCCRWSAYSRCLKPGVGPGESSAPAALACGWSFCGALRLRVGNSSSVSKEREKSLLISEFVCRRYVFVPMSFICDASGDLDGASACLTWVIPQSVL